MAKLLSTGFPNRKPQQSLYEYRKSICHLLGFDKEATELLASNDVDLHKAASLIDKGCSHDLCLRIIL